MRPSWKKINRERDSASLVITRLSIDLFRRQAEDVIARMNQERSIRTNLNIDSIFDLARWIDETMAGMFKGYRRVFRRGFDFGKVSAGFEGIDLTSDDPRVLDILTRLNGKSRLIPIETQHMLNMTLQNGISGGLSAEELTASVRSLFKNMEGYRAARIARTSGTAAFEGGQVFAFSEAGVTTRVWLSQPGARPGHAAADGQAVAVDMPFEVNGEKLMYPGDPAGSAGNIINCRCTQLPEVD